MQFREGLPSSFSFHQMNADSRIQLWVNPESEELLVHISKELDDLSRASIAHAVPVASAVALRDYLNTILED